MRIKYIVILSVLAVAFAAASLWVFLSGGKNAKAVKAKFKLGGMVLTVSGMLSLASCDGGPGGGAIMCYDPVMPEYVQFATHGEKNIVKAGDTIDVTIKDSPYKSHSYKLTVNGTEILQSGDFGKGNGSFQITIEPTDYKGDAFLEVYGLENGEEFYIGGHPICLE